MWEGEGDRKPPPIFFSDVSVNQREKKKKKGEKSAAQGYRWSRTTPEPGGRHWACFHPPLQKDDEKRGERGERDGAVVNSGSRGGENGRPVLSSVFPAQAGERGEKKRGKEKKGEGPLSLLSNRLGKRERVACRDSNHFSTTISVKKRKKKKGRGGGVASSRSKLLGSGARGRRGTAFFLISSLLTGGGKGGGRREGRVRMDAT